MVVSGDAKVMVMIKKGNKLVFENIVQTDTMLVAAYISIDFQMNLPVPPSHAESHGASMMPMTNWVIQGRIQPISLFGSEPECQARSNQNILGMHHG